MRRGLPLARSLEPSGLVCGTIMCQMSAPVEGGTNLILYARVHAADAPELNSGLTTLGHSQVSPTSGGGLLHA